MHSSHTGAAPSQEIQLVLLEEVVDNPEDVVSVFPPDVHAVMDHGKRDVLFGIYITSFYEEHYCILNV